MTDAVIFTDESRTDIMRLRPQWSNIAQDIVLSTMTGAGEGGTQISPDEICDAYEMTRAECIQLLKLPAFAKLVKDYRKRVDAMGDNASFTLRAQMLAAHMMESIYVDVMKPGAEMKDRIKVMEKLVQYGQLDPATNGQNKQKSEGGGNAAAIGQVIINVPAGIPGMEHIHTAVAAAPVTLEAESGNETP